MSTKSRFLSTLLFVVCLAPLASAQGPIFIQISITSSTDVAPLGVPITFTASVLSSCGYPTSLVFLDNGMTIPGSAAVLGINRVAAINLSLPAGFHSVAAQSANGCFGGSSGVPILVTTPGSYPSGSTYAQHGSKLVAADASGPASFGQSVAISADGNTAVIGGPSDLSAGAVWIFIRSGDAWVQQGSKLLGSSGLPFAGQGSSVAISSDGNTVLVGGNYENAAAWVFTRNNGIWSQQGGQTDTGRARLRRWRHPGCPLRRRQYRRPRIRIFLGVGLCIHPR
jgi:hypothetical protein